MLRERNTTFWNGNLIALVCMHKDWHGVKWKLQMHMSRRTTLVHCIFQGFSMYTMLWVTTTKLYTELIIAITFLIFVQFFIILSPLCSASIHENNGTNQSVYILLFTIFVGIFNYHSKMTKRVNGNSPLECHDSR